MGQWKRFNLILQHIVFFRLLFGEHMRRALYDTKHNGFDRSIDVYVSRLRQILGDDPYKPTYLKTVRRVGYLFATP